MTAAEIARSTSPEVSWVSAPWTAAGLITVVDGKPKDGKTSWVLGMVAATVSGAPFLGAPTKRSPVVYLTEEGEQAFRRRLERAGLLGCEDLHVTFHQKIAHLPFDLMVVQAAARCRTTGARLVVIDTLAQFAPSAESSAPRCLELMAPLRELASAGVAVLVTRHVRKSGGTVGDSGRGSGALTGAVDIILAIERPKKHHGTARLITSRSRFDETPERLGIELRDGTYHRLPGLDVEDAEVLAALPVADADALTVSEILERTALKKTSCREVLDRLVGQGRLLAVGSGTKGSPRKYFRREAA